MTVITRTPSASPPESIPPLENGDCLTREEFERRYSAMPHLKKAELLKGVVYVPSPMRLAQHGEPHADLVTWVGIYKLATPGLRGRDNSTVRLGPEDEPQPDVLLMVPGERGGQATVGSEGYVEGAPELAAEVAASNASYDLHLKLQVYQERGIREYIAWRVQDGTIDWFALRGDTYEPLLAGTDRILRSEVFPGLWLDPAALIAGDGLRLMAVLQQGIASPAHTAFVERLRQ